MGLLCLIMDAFGNLSYLLDILTAVLGELLDVITSAPLQFWFIRKFFKSTGYAVIGFLEEFLPYTDIYPACTVAWYLSYASHPLQFLRRGLGLPDRKDMGIGGAGRSSRRNSGGKTARRKSGRDSRARTERRKTGRRESTGRRQSTGRR